MKCYYFQGERTALGRVNAECDCTEGNNKRDSLVSETHSVHQHEEEKTGDRQTFDKHGQQGWIVFRDKHDEIDGQCLEEWDQFRSDALQLYPFSYAEINSQKEKNNTLERGL